jgi:2-amino-4-hydroxy-6-hydroxymethyldihydropteridine diphosphokinase
MTMESKQTDVRRAYIGLGSNLGNRENFLSQALTLLDSHPAVRVIKISALYETDPVGYTDQPLFLNMAALLETSLTAEQLLANLLEVEQKLGRKRDIRWGPRTIDLDLLIFGTEKIETPELTIPHPRMMERPFVLVPLREIINRSDFPKGFESDLGSGQTEGKEGVKRWKTMHWRDASGPSAN